MADNVVRRDFWDWFVNTYAQQRVINVTALRDEHDIEEIVKEWETLHPTPIPAGEKLALGCFAETITLDIETALVEARRDDRNTVAVYQLPNGEQVEVTIPSAKFDALDSTVEGSAAAFADLCREQLSEHLLASTGVIEEMSRRIDEAAAGVAELRAGVESVGMTTSEYPALARVTDAIRKAIGLEEGIDFDPAAAVDHAMKSLTVAIKSVVDSPPLNVAAACVEIRGLRADAVQLGSIVNQTGCPADHIVARFKNAREMATGATKTLCDLLITIADALDVPRDLNASAAVESVRALRQQLAEKERQLKGVPLGTDAAIRAAIGLNQTSHYSTTQITDHIAKLRNNSMTLAEISAVLPGNWHIADYAAKIRIDRQRLAALENEEKRHDEAARDNERIAKALGFTMATHASMIVGRIDDMRREIKMSEEKVSVFDYIAHLLAVEPAEVRAVLHDEATSAKAVRQAVRKLCDAGNTLVMVAREVGHEPSDHAGTLRAVKARDGSHLRLKAAEAKLAEIALVASTTLEAMAKSRA